MSEDNTQVMVGDEEFSLEQIAGIVMDDIEEYRLTCAPSGKYHWRILEAKLEAREVMNKEDPNGAKINKPTINFELESQNCLALTDDKLKPESQIGIKHNQTTWITDAEKDVGRVKAFLVDIGLTGTGALTDLLAQAQGVEFISDITNNKDKNNPDFVYANVRNPMTVDVYNETVNANG